MIDKFTIRDVFVYTLLGLVGFFFYYLHNPCNVVNILSVSKGFSDLTILLIIPISYILGHLIMSIDDFVFNGVLVRFMPKENPIKGCWKVYNFIFFGYRNIGVRNKELISNEDFLKRCDSLIKGGVYDKAEYYQVMSDLFKGCLLIIIFSMILDAIDLKIEIWKLIILFLIWFRAKTFSSYYVRMVKRLT